MDIETQAQVTDDLPDFNGCVRLLCAVARQWARDASVNAQHGSCYEMQRLADWLGVDAAWLRRQLDGVRPFYLRLR